MLKTFPLVRSKFWLLLLRLSLIQTVSGATCKGTHSIYQEQRKMCYWRNDAPSHATGGEDFCITGGGHLVNVEDQALQDFLIDNLSSGLPSPSEETVLFWIGAKKSATTGSWINWKYNEIGWSNWASNQPESPDICARIYKITEQWYNHSCDDDGYYTVSICEASDPESTTVTTTTAPTTTTVPTSTAEETTTTLTSTVEETRAKSTVEETTIASTSTVEETTTACTEEETSTTTTPTAGETTTQPTSTTYETTTTFTVEETTISSTSTVEATTASTEEETATTTTPTVEETTTQPTSTTDETTTASASTAEKTTTVSMPTANDTATDSDPTTPIIRGETDTTTLQEPETHESSTMSGITVIETTTDTDIYTGTVTGVATEGTSESTTERATTDGAVTVASTEIGTEEPTSIGDVIDDNTESTPEKQTTPFVTRNQGKALHCSCRCVKKAFTSNLSSKLKQLRSDLLINTTTTSKYIRSKTSIDDGRTSSRGIGVSGLLIFVLFLGALCVSDLWTVLFHCISSKRPNQVTFMHDDHFKCER